jgi:aspartate kinase
LKIVVQKYGGTSVSSPAKRESIVKQVAEARKNGYKVAVVVSAMGRKGDPYATDTLRSLLLEEYGGVPLRELDMIMSCGEIISAGVVAAALGKNGIQATVLTGAQAGFLTDGNYSQAEVVDCRPTKVLDAFSRDEVPIIAGFQGIDQEGEVNTIGRGGSDTTAVILGAALNAELVEIYTDVSGIMTADPVILKEAKVIQHITYGEVFQLANDGAKVIHPRAVEVAMRYNVAVVVRNYSDPDSGTLITGESALHNGIFSTKGRRTVTGIAHAVSLVQFLVEFPEPDSVKEQEIFYKIGEAKVNIDLINVFPEIKAFTVSEEQSAKVQCVLDELGLNYRMNKEVAKISVVGVGMHSISGVMARIVKALNEESIEILQSGDSNISISLLIKLEDLHRAVCVLHDNFLA